MAISVKRAGVFNLPAGYIVVSLWMSNPVTVALPGCTNPLLVKGKEMRAYEPILNRRYLFLCGVLFWPDNNGFIVGR